MPNYTAAEAPEGYTGDFKPFTLIPDDTTLEARLVSVEEDTKPFNDDDGNPVVKLQWTFSTEYEGQERKAWGETNIDFVAHPDCRFYAWVQELVGADLPAGFTVNTDDLIGNECRITLGQRTYTPKSGPNKGNKKTTNYVRDVMRSRAAMASVTSEVTDEPF